MSGNILTALYRCDACPIKMPEKTLFFACYRFCRPAGDCSPSFVIKDQSLTLCGQYRSVWITIASNVIHFGIAFGGPDSEKQLTNWSGWLGNKFESLDRLSLTRLSRMRFFRSHSKWNHDYYMICYCT